MSDTPSQTCLAWMRATRCAAQRAIRRRRRSAEHGARGAGGRHHRTRTHPQQSITQRRASVRACVSCSRTRISATCKSAGFLMAGGYAFQSFQPMLAPAHRLSRSADRAGRRRDARSGASKARRAVTSRVRSRTLQRDDRRAGRRDGQPGRHPAQQLSFPKSNAGDADSAFASAPRQDRCALHRPATASESDRADRHRRRMARRHADRSTKARRTPRRSATALRERSACRADRSRGDLALRRRRLRPEELAADADRARRGRRTRPGPSGEARRAARPALPRRELPSRQASIACGWVPTGRAASWPRSTRSMPRPRGTISFPANTPQSRRGCTALPNFRGRERLVRTDVQTPGYMRAPFEHAGVLRVRVAGRRAGVRLGQDPVALRLANDTATDPITRAAILVAPLGRMPATRRAAVRLVAAATMRRDRCVPTTAR